MSHFWKHWIIAGASGALAYGAGVDFFFVFGTYPLTYSRWAKSLSTVSIAFFNDIGVKSLM